MCDYNSFILDVNIKKDMAANFLEDVFEKAMDVNRMADVFPEDRAVLLSDNGAGYISRQFNECLSLVGSR